jgi:hypothetical protein
LQWARDAHGIEADMEHKLLEFLDRVLSHGFKIIAALPLVGEMALNF